MKKYLLIFVLVLLAYSTEAQNSADSIPNIFFKIFDEKGSDAAIDYVYATNKYISNNIAANLKVKSELRKIVSLIGKYHGNELIDKQSISDSYVRITYLARFNRQPLKFSFTMYKPNKIWQLQQLKFDDKVSEGFKN